MPETKISSGSIELDKFLEGGYEKEVITTIYGPAGSGKTNFCMLAAAGQAKNSKKIIFIDTEGGFSIERLKQIVQGQEEKIIDNILLLNPTNFEEQKKCFNVLLNEINKDTNIGLIIVDGMTMLYRLEIGDASKENEDIKIKNANSELAGQLRTLAEISRKKNIPIIITNQVYYPFIKNNFNYDGKREASMVGGDLLKYWSKCLLEIQLKNSRRKLLIKKHRNLPEKEFSFTITNSGIKKKGFLLS